jgi:ribosomal protein S18 acetylase RimI-like enzyme
LIEKYDRIRHNTEDVKSLLAMAVGRPTDGRLKKLLDVVYDIEGYLLYVTSEQGKITGIIGVDNSASPHGWILHLATHPDYRKQGIGRGLINEVMALLSLTSVGLETDQDTVNFYRACGFTAVEIPSKWQGVHRFRCIKGQPPKSVLEYYNNKKLSY